MPLIYRITHDMFSFSDICGYMVNPVNLTGMPSGGLSLEFRRRCPHYVKIYQDACRSKELRIGTVQVIEDTGQVWGIINFPTKNYYANFSDIEDIRRGLEALRDLLSQNEYKYSVIAMPMLGCGLGTKDYETILPLMEEYLSDLQATIFLCMNPDRTEFKPKYLGILGPSDYGIDEKEQTTIQQVIKNTIKKWNISLNDYTGILSTGNRGLESYLCGSLFLDNPHDTYVYKNTNKNPLVVKPNSYRDKVMCTTQSIYVLCEISDDIILFKPNDHDNNRCNIAQVWLEDKVQEAKIKDVVEKRVMIFGDSQITNTTANTLIPVNY